MNNELLFHKFIFINQILKKRNANDKSITHGQGRILVILHQKDGISTKELSEILNIKVTSLNETLNKLIKKGYVKKETSPDDKRVLLIYLTEKGRSIKPPKPKDLDIFDCLNDNEKKDLDRFLDLIAAEIHNKFRRENPEEYEMMLRQKEELFGKYFNCSSRKTEWFRLIENKK